MKSIVMAPRALLDAARPLLGPGTARVRRLDPLLQRRKAQPMMAAKIDNTLAPRVCGSFAPSVMATEIEPGPTVSGSVSG